MFKLGRLISFLGHCLRFLGSLHHKEVKTAQSEKIRTQKNRPKWTVFQCSNTVAYSRSSVTACAFSVICTIENSKQHFFPFFSLIAPKHIMERKSRGVSENSL